MSLGRVGGRELPIVLVLHHAKLSRPEVGQHSKPEACKSLTSMSAEIFDL